MSKHFTPSRHVFFQSGIAGHTSGFVGHALVRHLLLLALLLVPCVSLHAQSTPPVQDVSHLNSASSWPAVDDADLVSESVKRVKGVNPRLRIPTAVGSKFIASSPHGRFLLVTPGIANAKAMGSIYDLYRQTIYRKMPTLKTRGAAILNAEGTRLAAETNERGKRAIVVASVAPPRPLATINLENRDKIAWMAFVETRTLVVATKTGFDLAAITGYNTATAQPSWAIEKIDDVVGDVWAMSPNSRYLALAHQPKDLSTSIVRLYDTQTGKVAGEINLGMPGGDNPPIMGLSISPSGELLGIYCQPNKLPPFVLLYDATTGKPVEDMSVGELPNNLKYGSKDGNQLAFVDENILIAKDQLVLRRGQSHYVDTIEQSYDEKQLPMRTVGRSAVLRMQKSGSDGELYFDEVDIKALDDAAEKRNELIASRAINLPDALTPNVRQTLSLGEPDRYLDPNKWLLKVDPAGTLASKAMSKPVKMAYPPGKSFFASPRIAIAPSGRFIISLPPEPRATHAGLRSNPNDLPPEPAHLTYYDVDKGTSTTLSDWNLDPKTSPLAVSPDGSRCALLTGSRVDVYTLPQGKHVAGFDVVDSKGQRIETPSYSSRPVVTEATFTNDGLLIIPTQKEIMAWSVDDAKLKWSWQARWLLATPGGNYALLLSKQDYFFVDTSTGQIQASLPMPPYEWGRPTNLCMSPDGSKIVAYNTTSVLGRFMTFDLHTRKWTFNTNTSPRSSSHLQYINDKFILSGNKIVDLKSGASLWQFTGTNHLYHQHVSPLLWYYVIDPRSKQAAVHGVPIIQPAIENKLVTPPDFAPVFGKGSKLKVAVNMSAEARTKLEKVMNDAGVELSDDSDIQLVGDIKTESLGKGEFIISESRYGVPMPGRRSKDSKTVTIERYTTTRTLRMVDAKGQTLWQTASQASTGSSARLKDKNQDPAEALSSSERALRVDDYSSYVYQIPQLVYPHPEATLQGQSQLTLTGVTHQ